MRLRKVLSLSTMAAIVAGSAAGCNQGTDVSLAPAPQLRPAESTPLPKDVKKGGGSSSSGNMQKNPGGNS